MQLLPTYASKIQEIVDRPQTTIKELETVVSLDVALSTQILRVSNSAFFGLSREVETIRQALLILGFNATRDIALALAVMSMGKKDSVLNHRILQHSLQTAAAASLLARQLALGFDNSMVFVAGLVHDVGKLVMLALEEPQYSPLIKMQTSGDAVREKERELFGFDHAELGAGCLERWKLPEKICQAVEYHHYRGAEPISPLAALVSVANQLVELRDNGVDALAPIADSPTARQLRADHELLISVDNELDAAVADVTEMFYN